MINMLKDFMEKVDITLEQMGIDRYFSREMKTRSENENARGKIKTQ